jgi:hypothetical protein
MIATTACSIGLYALANHQCVDGQCTPSVGIAATGLHRFFSVCAPPFTRSFSCGGVGSTTFAICWVPPPNCFSPTSFLTSAIRHICWTASMCCASPRKHVPKCTLCSKSSAAKTCCLVSCWQARGQNVPLLSSFDCCIHLQVAALFIALTRFVYFACGGGGQFGVSGASEGQDHALL